MTQAEYLAIRIFEMEAYLKAANYPLNIDIQVQRRITFDLIEIYKNKIKELEK